ALNELHDAVGRLESLRRATELAPRFANAHAEMGHAFFSLNRTDEALASFRRATEIDPANISGHAGLTVVYLDRKDWALAAAAWRAAASLEAPQVEEGCTTSVALGSLTGYSMFSARELATGLIRLNRFNDLVGLCVDVNKGSGPQNTDFGRVHPFDKGPDS